MKKTTSIVIILLMAATAKLSAQVDPHFSQYYAYPMWLNPALTGVINGDVRVNANYKNQWATVNRAYQTEGLSADFRPTKKVSLGVNILNQSAGAGNFNYLAAYGSFGYQISVSNDENHRVSFGVQAGVINRSFNINDLQFGSQYNPEQGYDPSMPSFENFSSTSSTIFDANAGVFYYNGDPFGKVNAFGGASVSHLTRAKDPFTDAADNKIPLRYTLHGGIRFKMSEYFDLTPHAVYIRQQKNEIKGIGAYSELKFMNENSLILGGMYRFQDAAIANVGYRFNSLIIGASYDFNTSNLTTATRGQGGIEVSISYVFRKRIQEPEPICPRL